MDAVQAITLVAALVAAVGSVWAAVESRRTREDIESDRDRRAVRLALVELADALHRWQTWPPVAGGLVSGTPDTPVQLPLTRDMVARVTMAADVLGYLIWSTEAVRIISEWYLAVIFDRVPQIGNPSGQPFRGWSSNEGQDLWWATVGRIVDTAGVVLTESRRRGFLEIVTAFVPLFEVTLEREPAVDSLFNGTWEGLGPVPTHPRD